MKNKLVKYIQKKTFFGNGIPITEEWWNNQQHYVHCWTHPNNVKVELIGKADEKYKMPKIILASFNNG